MKVVRLKMGDFEENSLTKRQQRVVSGGWRSVDGGPPPSTSNGDIKDPDEETVDWIDPSVNGGIKLGN